MVAVRIHGIGDDVNPERYWKRILTEPPSLIFDARPDAGPEGRVFFFGKDFAESETAMTGVFVAQSTAYKGYQGGWLRKQIGDHWSYSRLAPGAVWFSGDIVLAGTWGSNTASSDGGVILFYQGQGIADIDMADFDDISFMSNYGMARSIGTFVQMPAKQAK